MKTLVKITNDIWLDLSKISGVKRIGHNFCLTIGDDGVSFPKLMTREEIKSILKQAHIAIGDF